MVVFFYFYKANHSDYKADEDSKEWYKRIFNCIGQFTVYII
jgi:hypothetical protein